MNNRFFNIENSIKTLITKFNKISQQGWFIKESNNHGEFGNNFEKLIGKHHDDLPIYDFQGIEIKTKKINSCNDYITLFNAIPYGKDFFEIERIKKEYGYPDKDLKNCNIFNGDIYYRKIKKIGNKFQFQIRIEQSEQKIKIIVFNHLGQIIDDSIYWPYEILKQKIYQKIEYLAIIKVKTKMINKIEYYKYEKISIYKFIDFETFLNAIRNDYIRIQVKIGVFKTGNRIGQTHNRGIGFQISENFIDKLYNRIF